MAILQLLTCIVESKRYTVYSRYIAELDISRSHVGTHFWRPRAQYFLRNRGNSLNPIRPQDNFSWNLLIAIAFVPVRRRQFFAKSTLAYLSNAGWNTCCAMVSHARWSIDTTIVSQSKVQLIHCQCKSRLQIANLDINTAFLIKSLLFGHAVYIRHLVQTPRQIRSKSRVRDW